MKTWRAVLLVAMALSAAMLNRAAGAEWVVVPINRTVPIRALAPAAERPGELAGNASFFHAAAGIYNGLVAPEGDIYPEHSGYFRISLSTQGSYSGYFVTGGNRTSIQGWFNAEGLAGLWIYKREWADCHCYKELVLVWTVELDLFANSDEIEGVIFNERHGWRTELYGLRAGYASSYDYANAPQAGRYTLRLPGSVDPVAAPPGDGYGAVKVNSRGLVELNGALPDGVKISDSAYLSYDGYYPLYVPLSDGKGLLQGWLQFVAGQLEGQLTWSKPSNLDRKHYPEGFSGTVHARGGWYLIPSGADSPFTWTEGQLLVWDGNVSGVLGNDVTFLSPGKVTVGGGDLSKLKLKVKTKNGVISGSFLHPVSGSKTSYAGALFQFEDAGGGYFLGIDLGGTVALVDSVTTP